MIKIGVVGYGNVGKSVLNKINEFSDLQLVAVFTRRNPDKFTCSYPIYHVSKLYEFKGKIDVLLLCSGSYKDVPETAKSYLKNFCTVDSYDNHKQIEEYVNVLNDTGLKNGTLAIVGAGWDPGIFSIERALFSAVTSGGKVYTVWGKGVSQGHTNVLKNLKGVRHAIQFTIPKRRIKSIVKKKSNALAPDLHKRKCIIVAEKGVDKKELVKTIKNIPDYFSGYKTTVKFISEKRYFMRYKTYSHGGKVFSLGSADISFNLSLKSNPEFTASVMLAYSKALINLFNEGKRGALSVLDVPIGSLVENKNAFL